MTVFMPIDFRALGLVGTISGDEVSCICPFHGDSHPSATYNVVKDILFCFACGAVAKSDEIINQTGGQIIHSTEVIREGRATRSAETSEWRKLLGFPLAFGNKYLESRLVTKEQIQRYGIRESSSAVIFPIRDTYGEVGGVQMRYFDGSRPKYKFFGNRQSLWPYDILTRDQDKPIYVVEGVFGVLRAELYGYRAIAKLGSTSTPLDAARALNGQKGYILFDDDFAGYVGASRISYLTRFPVIVPGAEADEMTEEEWKAVDTCGQVVFDPSQLKMFVGSKNVIKFLKQYGKFKNANSRMTPGGRRNFR